MTPVRYLTTRVVLKLSINQKTGLSCVSVPVEDHKIEMRKNESLLLGLKKVDACMNI